MDPRARLEEVALAGVGSMIDTPDTQAIERPGWYQLVTPSSGSSIGNEVVLSQLGADAEDVLRRTIRQYADAGVPFRWAITPLTEPADFGALLERYGFESWPTRGMALEPAAWTHPDPPGVTVEACTPDTIERYLDAFSRGWATPFAASWIGPHARAIARGSHAFYLASVDGAPAGTAGMSLKARSGYLMGGNVIAEHRGRGVYRALLAARLRDLVARGTPLATTLAMESSSAPILEHLGWETLYRSRRYQLADPRAAVARFGL